VRSLASGRYAAGIQRVSWDGCDERGAPVAAGIYFLRSETGGKIETVKVMVIR
jgi:hypothetical protein